MNTLRVLKGNDVSIYINDQLMCFVTDFKSSEISDVYRIEEILSNETVATMNLKKRYILTLTALRAFDSTVFSQDGFKVRCELSDCVYEYYPCRLKEKILDVESSKSLTDRYIIEASDMKISEVNDE